VQKDDRQTFSWRKTDEDNLFSEKRCQTIILQCGKQTKTVRGYLISTRSIADTVFPGKQIATVAHSKNDVRQVISWRKRKKTILLVIL
jgi:hypothetical protein